MRTNSADLFVRALDARNGAAEGELVADREVGTRLRGMEAGEDQDLTTDRDLVFLPCAVPGQLLFVRIHFEICRLRRDRCFHFRQVFAPSCAFVCR